MKLLVLIAVGYIAYCIGYLAGKLDEEYRLPNVEVPEDEAWGA